MIKKVIPLVLFGLLFGITGKAFADAAAQLEQAEAYKKNGQYEQAEGIYRTIIADYPGTDEAFQAQKNLALIKIITASYPEDEPEVDALITNFAEHPQLPAALYDIANHYWYRYRYGQSKRLFKWVGDSGEPENNLAMRGQTWSAGCEFRMGNYTSAWEEVNALADKFAEHPKLADMIYALAEACWYDGRYDQGRKLNKYIADNLPESEKYFRGRVWTVGGDIRLGNYEAAEAGLNKLITDFAGHPELAGVLYQLANEYFYVKRYAEAKPLFREASDRDPNHMRAAAWVIGCDFMMGNYADAQERVDKLIADFAGHEHTPWTIYSMGYENESSQAEPSVKYELSKNLYRKVIQLYPEHSMAGRAQLYLARADALSLADSGGDDTAAMAKLDNLLADFGDHPGLPEAIFRAGEQYYNEAFRMENEGLDAEARDHFTKAIALWQRIIQELPESITTPRAYFFTAICYRRTEAYEKAIDYFQSVVDEYPDYERAAYAQFVVGRIYEKMKNAGVITKSQANTRIKEAYENLLNIYPHSKWAQTAQEQLKWVNRDN